MKRFLYHCLLLGFLLGCHKGYVALWTDSSAAPAQVYPYPVSSLPLPDQIALEKGIEIENSQELARLLEDYLS